MARLIRCAMSLQLLLGALTLAAGVDAQAADRVEDAPEILLPVAEVQAQLASAKPDPLRYAVAHALNLDLRSGAWDAPEPGLARWRLRVRSPGARVLGLELDHVQLPDGAELRISDLHGGDLHGPLQASADGRLWTPMVRGESALLELRLPLQQQSAASLTVVAAQHGYRSPFDGYPSKGEFGDAGACNVDVACSDGNNWRPEIRSAVLLTISNSTLCSGTLVNNQRQDDRPLILTANHCGVNALNVVTTRAYFNVQKTSCGANSDGPITDNIAGLRFLASDSRSDFALFELALQPPANFNAYYAGWNADPEASPQSGVGIHHPSGDDKKISTYTRAARRADGTRIGSLLGGFTVDAWQVVWARGTTEGGSSGSGLWNQNHQLVGTLSGGSSSCDDTGAADFYGRLEQAWTASSARNGQLKAHLDPNSSGCLALPGKNPGSAQAAGCAADGGSTPGEVSGGGGGGSAGPLLILVLFGMRLLRQAIGWRQRPASADQRGPIPGAQH